MSRPGLVIPYPIPLEYPGEAYAERARKPVETESIEYAPVTSVVAVAKNVLVASDATRLTPARRAPVSAATTYPRTRELIAGIEKFAQTTSPSETQAHVHTDA